MMLDNMGFMDLWQQYSDIDLGFASEFLMVAMEIVKFR